MDPNRSMMGPVAHYWPCMLFDRVYLDCSHDPRAQGPRAKPSETCTCRDKKSTNTWAFSQSDAGMIVLYRSPTATAIPLRSNLGIRRTTYYGGARALYWPRVDVDIHQPNHPNKKYWLQLQAGSPNHQQIIQRLPPHSARPYYGVDCGRASSIS